MPSWQSAVRRFFSDQRGNVRIADNQLFAVGRNTVNQACTAQEEGTKRWTRGGTGAASYEEICLKSASDTYAWTTGTSGGSPGLAAHILDTTTHGTTGDIVGTTDTQTLTNKTLTSPTITTPNGLVKGDVGLGNVDNTSDATKNSAVATLTNKTLTSPVINSPTISSPSGLVKGDVGLGNVDNTSDATKNAAAVTLTNKTLTTPTIGDFTNATHAHTSAASGGTLSASAIASGTIGTARLGAGVADSSVFLRGDQTWSELPIAPGVWPAAFVNAFGTAGTGDGQFSAVRGVAVHPVAGDVFVASDDRIQKFSSNGTFSAVLATVGSGNGQVDEPAGIDVYARSLASELWVADRGNLRAQHLLASDGTYVTEVSTSPFSPNNVDVSPSYGLVISTGPTLAHIRDAQGRGYAIQTSTPDQIFVDDSGGNFLFFIGETGTGKGQLDTPVDLELDALGNLYVVDQGNHRVQVFSGDGMFRGEFGSFGTGDGEFDTPTAIAIANDYIYVADSGNSRVQIFANPVGARALEIVGDQLTIMDETDLSKQVQFSAAAITTNTVRTLTVPDASGTLALTTISDADLTIQDDGDPTKQVQFEVSGVTTATTRTLTVPDANGTISVASGMYVTFWTTTPAAGGYAWTNMPASVTEVFGSTARRMPVDLTGFREARLICEIRTTAGAAGSVLRIQYSTNGGGSWNALAASGNVETAISTVDYHHGTWTPIASGAQTDVLLRIVGAGGNGAADPEITMLSVQFR